MSRTTAEQQSQILELRSKGFTYQKIADELDISVATANRIVLKLQPSETTKRSASEKRRLLPQTTSGNFFRSWFERQVRALKSIAPAELGIEETSDENVIAWISEHAEIDVRQIRQYTNWDVPDYAPKNLGFKPRVLNTDKRGGNPSPATVVKIGEALRGVTPLGAPLIALGFVPHYWPHALGIIGNICEPGPTPEFLEFWPAIQWFITREATLEEHALHILGSVEFDLLFQRAWRTWTEEREDTYKFPQPLQEAIEHSRETQRRWWHLTDRDVEIWVRNVERNPRRFGRRMRYLDSKASYALEFIEESVGNHVAPSRMTAEKMIEYLDYLWDIPHSERERLEDAVVRTIASVSNPSDFVATWLADRGDTGRIASSSLK